MTTTTTTPTPDTEEAREDRAEAAEHRGDAAEHRREAAHDRREAAADRAEGDPVEALGNRAEAAVHDTAARGHEAAARHDEREAADESRGASVARPHTTAPSAVSEAAGPAGGTAAAAGTGHTALVPDEQRRRLNSRWDDIQAGFIDNPRESVAKADALVRDATNALHDLFERDRRQLEGVWDRGENVSTEDLRVTLQRYRSFFERLLSL